MKIVQLGTGVCGRVCAEHMAKNPKVDELVLADLSIEPVKALARRAERVTVVRANGTDRKTLKSLLKNADLVIATMPWRLNIVPLEVAEQVGCNYLDFGMPMDSTGPEFDKHFQACKNAGIAAMVGMGEEPGMSDVFAMHLASKLDVAYEADVYDGDTGSIEGMELFSLWSPVDLIDETSVPAAVYRNSRIEFIPPLSSHKVFNFPEPLGPLTVYKTNHDETYFMPMGIKTLRNASFNICIDEKFARAMTVLRKLGLLSKETVEIKGVKVKPEDVVAAMLPSPSGLGDKVKGDTGFVVELVGEHRGQRTKARMWTTMSHQKAWEKYRTNAGAYYVGTGGAVVAEMFVDGEVKDKGFVIPEQLDPSSFLRRIHEKDVSYNEELVRL